MRYDDSLIEQVQHASDIVDIISQFVPMKKAGRNFKACCPFHQEKSPSFMVSAEKQIYHCFGCGAGGNVFGFLMAYEHLTFPEALRRLADRAHIQLPEKSSGERRDRSENEKIYEVYDMALAYYRANFLQPQEGKIARDYFMKRGFTLELAEEFEVGWAPDGWKGLYEHLSKKGITEELLIKSRLINKSDKGSCYDVFRGRVMFPIRNLQGRTVAFGGRAVAAGQEPKYLNSPENPVFVKRRELYGLHLAKRHVDRENPRILVVEGYLDFLRLYSEGFKYSAASLGTALTEEHVAVLKRFCEEVVVVYDGDKAGEAASLRGLEVLLEGQMNVKVVQLPEGNDPDDFLRKFGREAFQKLLDQSRDFFDYKLAVLSRRHNRSETLGLMKITSECLETLTKIESPVLLDRYLKKLSSALGVDAGSLRAELRKLKEKKGYSSAPVMAGAGAVPARKSAGLPEIGQDEVMLLGILLEEPSWVSQAGRELSEGDFQLPGSAQLFRLLCEGASQSNPLSFPAYLNRLEDGNFKKSLTAAVAWEWEPAVKERAFQDCLKSIQRKRIQRRMEDLRREIADAELRGDQQKILEFTREFQSLLHQTR